MTQKEKELKKRTVLRMSNAESHRLTKECIQTALIYLMNNTPFDKITITSIINRSGVSRAAFYRNYASKEEVLEEIVKEFYDFLAEAISSEKYISHPEQWYFDFFSAIQKNTQDFKYLVYAKLPDNLITLTKPLFLNPVENPTPEQYYKEIAWETAFTEIVLSWFKNGMKETPAKMSEICLSLFYK